ncbi:MAG TPA: DUF4352 domain-containing protein, partial [Bryobacteraceae bacterium]|nr:DUF4352 domain-containing protein [Bryobacteraceae bacterium]
MATMHFPSAARGLAVRFVLVITALSTISCNLGKDNSNLGTFPMGQKVQAGPLAYSVTEAEWRNELEGGHAPANRFLFLRMSITNNGGTQLAIPSFSLNGRNDKTYSEVTENTGAVTGWMGMLRSLSPGQTEQGWIIFDAP